MANNGPSYTRLGPGDFSAPAERELEPGAIWGDMAEVETALKDWEFFVDEAAEIMADYLISSRDKYAEQKMMTRMLVLSDRCEAHINALESDL